MMEMHLIPVTEMMLEFEIESENGAHSVEREALTQLIAEHEEHRRGVSETILSNSTNENLQG